MPIASTGSAVPYGVSWSTTDTVYVGSFSGMWAVPATGGVATPRWRCPGIGATDRPALAARSARRQSDRLRRAETAPRRRRGYPSSRSPRERSVEYDQIVAMPLGVIGDQFVYVSPSGGLMAVRFDVDAGKPIGEPVQLDEACSSIPPREPRRRLSASGTLAYLRGRAQFQPVMMTPPVRSSPRRSFREPGVVLDAALFSRWQARRDHACSARTPPTSRSTTSRETRSRV